jgi:uncharacterized coiled-coil DUF342 family protein
MPDNIRKEIEAELKVLKGNLGKFSNAVDLFEEAKQISEETRKQLIATADKSKKTLEKSGGRLEELISEHTTQIEKLNILSEELSELQKGLNDAEIVERSKKIESLVLSLKEGSSKSFDNVLSELEATQKELREQIKVVIKSSNSNSESLSRVETGLGNSFKGLSDQLNKSFSKLLKDMRRGQNEVKDEFLNKLKTHQAITFSGLSILILMTLYLIIF